MELVLSPGRIGGENNTGSPFQNQEVREWSHVDRLTGMLEHARIETGRWQARHQGTAQAYGKVIDSRERNSADGNVVQKARRQVEVFQSQGIGGRSVQVVRASQWSSSRITDSTSSSPVSGLMNDVPQLRNGNDELTSTALKSVNGRLQHCGDESLTKLSQVSRLCRQINEETMNKRTNLQIHNNGKIGSQSPLMSDRLKKFEGFGIEQDIPTGKNGSPMINSVKSTSNEDLTKSDDPIVKSHAMFTRDCKSRRSLQIPKSVVLDFEKHKNTEIRANPEGTESSVSFIDRNTTPRNSPSSDLHDTSIAKNDRKMVKSYVLGMEEPASESSSIPPKTITEKKILFNGTSINENGKDGIIKSEYLRPTPILLKPKSNTTVVHLNNKLFLAPDKNGSKEITEPLSIVDNNKPNAIRTLVENDSTIVRTTRVQSLANRFSHGNTFPYDNSLSSSLGKKQSIIDSSTSRIEGLINRATVLNGGENSMEVFPNLLEKKVAVADETNKPIKRVGFCKTEVHFAAESGKVNIVETDCKPPPSNRFRRRRRNSIVNNTPNAQNKNLPLIHFGDTSYEKYIFGQSNGTGSFKSENSNVQNKEIPKIKESESIATVATAVEADLSLIKEKISEQRLIPPEEMIIRDGWRSRLKTILQAEPPPIITDELNDDLSDSRNDFNPIDETIVDHSFRGHTTTVNLGANVITKLPKHATNEGKCNSAISTGIQLEFNARLQKVMPVSNTSDITPSVDDAKIDRAKNIVGADKTTAPYSIVVSTVSKIPRPLIQSQQSVLKSAHLVMNLNKIKSFNSIVKSTGNGNSFSNNSKKNENSLTLKHLLSSLQDNCGGMVIPGGESDVDIVNNNYPRNAATLITINTTDSSMINYKNRITNSHAYPTRFTPLRLKYFNERLNQYEERKRIEDPPDDGGDNQLQYSSGSEQADEEVRSYMLGTKIHRSYTQHKKFSHSRSITAEESANNVHKSQEEFLSSSTVIETGDNDDSIDNNIDQNHIIDDELESDDDAGLPVEEICLEANKTVEKNHVTDKIMSESNVVTSDNENNKVLMNIVTTHEPVIARVEDSHPTETRRELFSGKKVRAHSTTQLEEKETIVRETHRSDKSIPLNEKKTSPKHKAKDHCDNESGKEVITSSNGDRNRTDPTYVNVFENGKKSIPIYENYLVTRKNNLNDKKYSKKNMHLELNTVIDTTSKSTNGNCESEPSLSNTDCEGENLKQYSKSRDSDAKLTTISENNYSSKRNNRESHKIKPSKTRSKKIVRSPSSTSSIESVHRSSANETAKDSDDTPQHTKSTRSSRLHRVTSSHETSGKETVERYSSNEKKKNTSERTSNRKVPRSDHASDTSTAVKNDQAVKNLNDSTRSKKPIEIVYQTAVFNMKNEKLAKSSRSKESKTPRYINDLICGSKPKRSTDARHVKGTALSQQRVHHKSASPTNSQDIGSEVTNSCTSAD